MISRPLVLPLATLTAGVLVVLSVHPRDRFGFAEGVVTTVIVFLVVTEAWMARPRVRRKR